MVCTSMHEVHLRLDCVLMLTTLTMIGSAFQFVTSRPQSNLNSTLSTRTRTHAQTQSDRRFFYFRVFHPASMPDVVDVGRVDHLTHKHAAPNAAAAALLQRASNIRAAHQKDIKQRVNHYHALRVIAEQRAIEEQNAGLDPQPIPPMPDYLINQPTSPVPPATTLHGSIPESACSLTITAARQRAVDSLSSGSRAPRVSLVNVLQCYASEKSLRDDSIARCQSVLARSRALRTSPSDDDRPKSVVVTHVDADTQSHSGLSHDQSAQLLLPKSRLYDASTNPFSIGSINSTNVDEEKTYSSLPLHSTSGAPDVAAASDDPIEIARQKARARITANFDAIQAETNKASALAKEASRMANWPRRIEWHFVGLFISLWFTFVTPFSAAFYSSTPYTWVNLNAPPFNPRYDSHGELMPGPNPDGSGVWDYPFYSADAGKELHWLDSNVLPWLVIDFLFSIFFMFEVVLLIRHHAGGYLYSSSLTHSHAEEEAEELAQEEAEREKNHERCSMPRICVILQSKRWRTYMRHFLWMDVISCLPYELIAVVFDELRWSFFIRLIRIWFSRRMFIYIQLIRLRWKDYLGRPQAHTQRIFFLFLRICSLIHWFACLWFFLSAHDFTTFTNGRGAHNSWLKSTCESLRECESIFANYLNALYWSSSNFAMVGCNDIFPSGDGEFLLNIFILWVGFTCEKLVVATVTSAMHALAISLHSHEKKFSQINSFCQQHHVTPSLQHQINAYGDFMWSHFRGGTESFILGDLPFSLRKRVLRYILYDLLSGTEYFEGMPEKVLREICLFLKPLVLPPHSIICHEQPYGRELYFISRGEVERLSKDGTKILGNLKSGDCFGYLRMFTLTEEEQEWELERIRENQELDAHLHVDPAAVVDDEANFGLPHRTIEHRDVTKRRLRRRQRRHSSGTSRLKIRVSGNSNLSDSDITPTPTTPMTPMTPLTPNNARSPPPPPPEQTPDIPPPPTPTTSEPLPTTAMSIMLDSHVDVPKRVLRERRSTTNLAPISIGHLRARSTSPTIQSDSKDSLPLADDGSVPHRSHARHDSHPPPVQPTSLPSIDDESQPSIVDGICKATSFCEIYVLTNDDLALLLQRYPKERKILLEKARASQKKNYNMNQQLMMSSQSDTNRSGTTPHPPSHHRRLSSGGGGGGGTLFRPPSLSLSEFDSTRHLFMKSTSGGATTLNIGSETPKYLKRHLTIPRADATPRASVATNKFGGSKLVADMIAAANEEQKLHDSNLHTHTTADNADASKADRLSAIRSKGVFNMILAPASTFRLIWSIISVGWVMYLAISVPITVVLALDPFIVSTATNESWWTEPWFLAVNVACDAFFLFDIYLHFNHFAYMHHGLVIRKLRHIRKHYVYEKSDLFYYFERPYHFMKDLIQTWLIGGGSSSASAVMRRPIKSNGDASSKRRKRRTHQGIMNGFVIDLIMTFPFEVLAAAVGVHLGGLFRINRILRVFYLFYYFTFIELYLQNVERDTNDVSAPSMKEVLKDPLVAGVVNIEALPGSDETNNTIINTSNSNITLQSITRILRETFFTFHINHKFIDLFRYILVMMLALWMLAFLWILVAFLPSLRGTSWLERDHLHVKSSVSDTWIRSMFLTLLSRTADSEAVKDFEICMSILVMLIGMFLVPGIVGLLEGVVENLDAVSHAFEEKRTIVRAYMQLRQVPNTLQTRILSFYDFLWSHNSVDEEHIQHNLPKSLHATLSVHRFEKLLHKFEFIRGCEPSFLRDFATVLQWKVLPPGLRIYACGSVSLEMFVVVTGELRVVDTTNRPVVTLLPGSVYGSTSLLMDPPPIRKESVMVIDYSQLVILTRAALLSVLDLHPLSQEFIAKNLERTVASAASASSTTTSTTTTTTPTNASDNLSDGVDSNGSNTAPTIGSELEQRERMKQRNIRKRNLGMIRTTKMNVSSSSNSHAGGVGGDVDDVGVNSNAHTTTMSTTSTSSTSIPPPMLAQLRSTLPQLQNRTRTNLFGDATSHLPIGHNPRLFIDEGCIILPDSKFNFIWHVLCLIATLWNIFCIPMRLAFLSDPSKFESINLTTIYIFDYGFDIFFLIDLLLRCRFMSIVVSGETIRFKRMIFLHYLRHGFITDLVASLPIDIIVYGIQRDAQALPWYRLNKLLRFTRQTSYFHFLQQYLEQIDASLNPALIRSFQLLLTVCQLAHGVACLWFGMSFTGFGSTFKWVDGESWAHNDHIHDSTISWQYHRSIYWALSVMSMLFQGDINPLNSNEMIVFILVILLGITAYAAFIANFVTLLSHESSHTQPFYDHMQQLTQFMETQRLPTELRRGIHSYYHRVLMRHAAIEETLVYEVLPNFFRSELTHSLARPCLESLEGLKKVSSDFLHHLLQVFLPQCFVPHQFIVRSGQISSRLFVILEGHVERWEGSTGLVREFLKDSQSFGWKSVLKPHIRKTSMLPTVFTDTFMLEHKDLIRILKLYPQELFHLYGEDASWEKILPAEDGEDVGGPSSSSSSTSSSISVGAHIQHSRAEKIAKDTKKRLEAKRIEYKVRQQYHSTNNNNNPLGIVRTTPSSSPMVGSTRRSKKVQSLVDSILTPVTSKDLATHAFEQRASSFYGQVNLISSSVQQTNLSTPLGRIMTPGGGGGKSNNLESPKRAGGGVAVGIGVDRTNGSISVLTPLILGSVEEEDAEKKREEEAQRTIVTMMESSRSEFNSNQSSESDELTHSPSDSDSESGSDSECMLVDGIDSSDLSSSSSSPSSPSLSVVDALTLHPDLPSSGLFELPSPIDSTATPTVLQVAHDIDDAQLEEERKAYVTRKESIIKLQKASRHAQREERRADKNARILRHATSRIERASLATLRADAQRAAATAQSHANKNRLLSNSLSRSSPTITTTMTNEQQLSTVEIELLNARTLSTRGNERSTTLKSPVSNLSTPTNGSMASIFDEKKVPNPVASTDVIDGNGDVDGDGDDVVKFARRKSIAQQRRRTILASKAEGTNGLQEIQGAIRMAYISSPWVKTSRRRNIWGTISFILLLYYIFLVPFHIAFYATAPAHTEPRSSHIHSLIAGWCADAFFLCDIILRLTVFVRIEHGGEVLSGWLSAKKYMKSWQFTAHLIQAMPIDIILLLTDQPIEYVYWVRATRLIRLHQLFSMWKHFENLLSDFGIQLDQISLRMLKVLIWFLVVTHTMTCVYFFVGYYENSEVSWIYQDTVKDQASLDNSTFWYIRALWWATASAHGTAGGKGRYPPKTTAEMIVAMILHVLSAGTDVMFISTFAISINSTDASTTRFEQKLKLIKRYLEYRHIPLSLRKRILDYYNYSWELKRGVEESDLLQDVPFNLKNEILIFRSSFLLTQVPLFEELSNDIIRSIAVCLRSHTYPPSEYVVEAGEIGNSMYFIENGTVEVIEPISREIRVKLHSGSFFGEVGILLGTRRAMSVRTHRSSFVDLFVLERIDFDVVMEQYPYLREQLLRKVKLFLNGRQQQQQQQ